MGFDLKEMGLKSIWDALGWFPSNINIWALKRMTVPVQQHNSPSEKSGNVNGLDSIRFVLALTVFLSHTNPEFFLWLRESDNVVLIAIGRLVPTLFCGTGAVIAFFIVSGFIIHYLNKDEPFDAKKFLIKRCLRIAAPPLVIFLLGLIFLKENLLLRMPLWSLYCELVYYVLYPLLRKIKVSWTIQFVVTFIISYVFIVILDQHDINSLIHQQDLGYVIGGYGYMQFGDWLTWIIGLPCWILGVVLAEKFSKSTRTSTVPRILVVRFLMAACTSAVVILCFKFYVSYMISMNIFALVLYVWLFEELVYYKTHRSLKFFEELGKSSYSLYLLHRRITVGLEKQFGNNAVVYFPLLVAVVAVAYLFYLAVENPTHKFAQRFVRRLPQKKA